MSASRVLKWVTGGLEALLGIPILGGSIVVGFYWTPLGIMLVLHIVTLILTTKDEGKITGSILGIVTSCIGWIPFVGWILHILSAIFLMLNAASPDNKSKENIVISE
ncbi:hypothetical protein [Oceanobacillus halotolerans]|uniref:hypothetical protein n=1 Tax=Oceanobacillus halotolerans TaxID=2663380 RepID=UPI0013DA5097|nr:hypothetical protein [Oceanobacillus halotolerans]